MMMVVSRNDDTISLPGAGGSGAFDPGVPTGPSTGGGMSTNLLNSTTVEKPEPLLFAGYHTSKTKGSARAPLARGRALNEPHVTTVKHREMVLLTPSQLLRAFDGFTRQEYLKFRNKMIAAGLVSENADPASVRSTYSALLGDITDMQKGGAKVSPIDYVNNLIRLNGLNPAKIGGSADYSLATKESAEKSWTNTSKSVYDLDPASARLMLEQTLQQKLGRNPSEGEIEDFIDAARTKASRDPSVSTTKYHTDAAGNTVSSTTTNDGFGADDAALMAENRAKKAPDYRSYQAISTYFPALVSALGSTV